MKRFAGIAAAALVTCALATGCAGETGSAGNAITVSASASAQVEPDTADIAFTLSASADTQEAARAAIDQLSADAESRLHALGLSGGDVTRGEVKLAERFGEAGVRTEAVGYEDYDGNWVETTEEVYYDETGVVVGYDAKVRVRASDVPADRLGQVVRESAAMGASSYGGLVYRVSDREAAYQRALAEAVDAAHAKAESLAQAGGVYVGRVVNLVEDSSAPEEVAAEADAGFIDPANPATFEVIPDKLPVTASVTASYAIS